MAEVRVTGAAGLWEAGDGGAAVGALRAYTRPDRRTFLSFRDCRADAYAPLLAAAAAGATGHLYTSVDEQDRFGLRRLCELGFVVSRHEHRYRVPTDPGRFRLPACAPPPGVALVSAADADLDRLRMLDDTLRGDTPGADGWRWSPEEFREETYSDGFDPATYLVAVEQGTGAYLGLMRLWLKAAGPRFGFVGVLPRWRRTRVTYALLSAVFGEVHRRGMTEAVAEIDATNRASNAIAVRAGAARAGGAYELARPGWTRR